MSRIANEKKPEKTSDISETGLCAGSDAEMGGCCCAVQDGDGDENGLDKEISPMKDSSGDVIERQPRNHEGTMAP